MIVTIILIIALICFVLAAFGVGHIALVPVGLALLTIAWLVTAFPGVKVKSNK